MGSVSTIRASSESGFGFILRPLQSHVVRACNPASALAFLARRYDEDDAEGRLGMPMTPIHLLLRVAQEDGFRLPPIYR